MCPDKESRKACLEITHSPRFTKSSLRTIITYMLGQAPSKKICQASFKPFKRRTTTKALTAVGRSTQPSSTAVTTSKVQESTKWRRLCLPNPKASSRCHTNRPTLPKSSEWARSPVASSCQKRRGSHTRPITCTSCTSG